MDLFIPLSPDPFLINEEDMSLAKFGHINAIVKALNDTIPSGVGLMYQSQYDPFNTGIVLNSSALNSKPGSYYLDRDNHTGTQPQSSITNLVNDLALKGDMFKLVYDSLDNGIVNDSRLLESLPGSFYLDRLNHTGTQAQSTIVNLVADLANKVETSELGVNVATLSGGLVPLAQLPFAATAYQGLYDGSTNTPVLANGIGTAGQFLITNVAGAAGPMGAVVLNQIVAYDGATWQAGPLFTGGISSVNGNAGPVVVLDLDDIPDTVTRAAVLPVYAQGLAASFFPISGTNPVVSQQEITNLNLALTLKGDMFKATYDTNNNGIVDNSERLGANLPAYYLSRANHSGTQAQSTIVNLVVDLSLKENKSEKGVANGYCDLDASGKVPASRLNLSAVNYQNSWNAFTNVPFISDGVGTAGDAYLVGVAGTRNLGSGLVSYVVGDLVVYNGSVWQKIISAAIGVSSWNGMTGAVSATTANLPDSINARYVNDNVLAALNGASSPGAGNVFITTSDISTISGDIATLQGDVITINADLALKEDKANKGIPLGYCDLDAGGKVPLTRLTLSAFNYQNSWNATTNTPFLSDGIGAPGDAYIVGTAGTIDLGSGNITFAIGDLAIYNGAVWQKITGVAPGVSSVNGFTGAVTLTADNIAETATRFYPNAAQNAALDASINPSGSNRYMTYDEVSSMITVGVGYFMPELFANGETLGDGTLRTLASLGYTNGSAAAIWTKVDGVYTIDVNTMSIDWIAIQEAFLTMQQTGYSKIISPGGRGYCPNQMLTLPLDQIPITLNRRGLEFIFDWQGSATMNLTGGDMVMYSRYFTNQTEISGANSYLVDYKYKFENFYGKGNGGTTLADTFIRLGATGHSSFTDIETNSFGCGINAEFCLESMFTNIKHVNYGLYGSSMYNGRWTGAGTSNAQSNVLKVVNHRCVAGSGKTATAGLYMGGNTAIHADTLTFEGFTGSLHHIFYDNPGTQGENPVHLSNLYFENAGASVAAIKFKADKGDFYVSRWNNIVAYANMPILVEAQHRSNPPTGVRQLYISLEHACTNQGNGGLPQLSSVSQQAIGLGHFWDVRRVNMPNKVTLNVAANFSLAHANSVIPQNSQVYYEPSPI